MCAIACLVSGLASCSSKEKWPAIDISNQCDQILWVHVSGDAGPDSDGYDNYEPPVVLPPNGWTSLDDLTFRGGMMTITISTDLEHFTDQHNVNLRLEDLPLYTDSHGVEHRSLELGGDLCPSS